MVEQQVKEWQIAGQSSSECNKFIVIYGNIRTKSNIYVKKKVVFIVTSTTMKPEKEPRINGFVVEKEIDKCEDI